MRNNYKYRKDNAKRDFVLALNPNDPDKLYSIIIEESFEGKQKVFTNRLMTKELTLEEAMKEYLA